jgi:hypothetical protein
MTTAAAGAARGELRETEALWHAHVLACEVCKRAERFRGLYCGRGRRLYRSWQASKRLLRRHLTV